MANLVPRVLEDSSILWAWLPKTLNASSSMLPPSNTLRLTHNVHRSKTSSVFVLPKVPVNPPQKGACHAIS